MKKILYFCVMAILVFSFPLAVQANGSYHFGFKKSKQGELPSIAQEGFMELLRKNNAVFLGDTQQKELYLTFDSGYENGSTAHILDVLKNKKVPAVFFITGHYVNDQPELVKRMVAEGHLIGNHSWSHPDMTTQSADKITAELDRLKSAVTMLTGQSQMTYLRPPRGIFNAHVLEVASKAGYTTAFWSIAYKDWETNVQRGAQYAFQQVTQQFHPGAVILLHSVSKDNAAAMAQMIDEARRQGYTFKRLDEMKQQHYR